MYPNKHDPENGRGIPSTYIVRDLGAATNNLDGDGVLRNRRQPAAFTALLLTRKYVLWRYALVCRGCSQTLST